MTMLGARATRRRPFAIAISVMAAAVVLTSSGSLDGIRGDPAGPPLSAAAAATTTALVPARVPVHRRAEAPPRVDPSVADRSGVLLYFLIEATRPQALFAR
jgi:hypothetical protein